MCVKAGIVWAKTKGRRFVQCEIEEQLDSQQIEAEHHALDHGSHLILYQRQAHLAPVSVDDAQTAPAWGRKMFSNERHQLPIHVGKDQGSDLDACVSKGLGGHHANRIGLISQIGEELIEFGLHGTLLAREQET